MSAKFRGAMVTNCIPGDPILIGLQNNLQFLFSIFEKMFMSLYI